MEAKFCVISPTAVNRVFKTTKELAEQHADDLLRKTYAANGKPAKMFIVEVVGVVEIGKPVVESRAPSEEDFPKQAEGDDRDDEDVSDEELAKRGTKTPYGRAPRR